MGPFISKRQRHHRVSVERLWRAVAPNYPTWIC